MKTIENRFGVNVELRSVGDDVVAIKISTSLRFSYADSACISTLILAEILPVWTSPRSLYDGSFVVVSGDIYHTATTTCIPRVARSFDALEASLELEDGLIHPVRISLDQSDDKRRDYVIADTRFIELRGKIAVEIECDDEEESDK